MVFDILGHVELAVRTYRASVAGSVNSSSSIPRTTEPLTGTSGSTSEPASVEHQSNEPLGDKPTCRQAGPST